MFSSYLLGQFKQKCGLFKEYLAVVFVQSLSLCDCGPQHTRLFCPPLSPRLCSNSCPLRQWCYLIISSSAAPFSFCLQSFPASGSFPRSQLFASGCQSIGASASASVLPMNSQGWFPLPLTGLISLLSKGHAKVFSSTNSKASVFQCSAFFIVWLTSVHDSWIYSNITDS